MVFPKDNKSIPPSHCDVEFFLFTSVLSHHDEDLGKPSAWWKCWDANVSCYPSDEDSQHLLYLKSSQRGEAKLAVKTR